VTISSKWLDGRVYFSGSPDSLGIWRIAFPPAKASEVPFDLTFTSSNSGESITLYALLVGDVWLCSGQSNMASVQIKDMWNVTDIVTAASAVSRTLRLFVVNGNTQSQTPLQEWPASYLTPWQPPIGGENSTLLSFSAACYLMGYTLTTEYIPGVPLGLILSAHGGTSIQAWLSPQSVNSCGDNSNSWNSSVLYNSNFHPATVGPLSLAGVYWYQGEQDCGLGATETYWRSGWYGCSLRALIRDWRARLGDPSLFWLEQQLHAWIHSQTPGPNGPDIGLATFRATQIKVLQEPSTALSTAFDGGDPGAAMAGSPGGTVHSKAKHIPARRAAAALAGRYYKIPAVPYLNPRYSDALATSTSNGTHTILSVTITLAPGSVGPGGLVQRGWEPASNSSHCPSERGVNASSCDWFSIQVNDEVLSWLNASVSLLEGDDSIVLTATARGAGLAAIATRNGFSDWPVVSVYSVDGGLPLMPWLAPINAVGAFL